MTKPTDTLEVEKAQLPQVYIDDVLMSLKYFVDEHDPHIVIVNPEACLTCENKGCLYFCPVGAYREQPDGHVILAYQSCIECGSCRLMCPEHIRWKLPRGGHGVAYKFG